MKDQKQKRRTLDSHCCYSNYHKQQQSVLVDKVQSWKYLYLLSSFQISEKPAGEWD